MGLCTGSDPEDPPAPGPPAGFPLPEPALRELLENCHRPGLAMLSIQEFTPQAVTGLLVKVMAAC